LIQNFLFEKWFLLKINQFLIWNSLIQKKIIKKKIYIVFKFFSVNPFLFL